MAGERDTCTAAREELRFNLAVSYIDGEREQREAMSDLYVFWSSFGAETKAALIGAVSTVSVGIIGFGGLILQIRSQGKQSRDSVAENERRRLKAAMFEDAVLSCREVADTSIKLSNTLRTMMLQLEYAAHAHPAGQQYDFPAARFPKLLEEYAQFSDTVLKFVLLVENRQVVDPRILIFRTAMSVVLHDTRNLMHSKFVAHVMRAIPTQLPDGTIFPYTPPSVAQVAGIKALCEQFIDSLGDAVAYTEDFLVELQNHLLGDLFNKEVAHRKPYDPAKKVVTFEQADELERWFANSTAWGKDAARIEAEAAARFPSLPQDR